MQDKNKITDYMADFVVAWLIPFLSDDLWKTFISVISPNRRVIKGRCLD